MLLKRQLQTKKKISLLHKIRCLDPEVSELRHFYTMVEEEQVVSRQEQQADDAKIMKRKKWLKRAGIVGFFFFLIKGLVWIAVALFAWKGCSS
jgi:hypothetical protein